MQITVVCKSLHESENLPLYVSFCDGDFLGKVQKVFKKAFLIMSFWELRS